jgi:hypothetical protein
MKTGIEGSPHYDVTHTVTLFEQLVHGLAVSWFYSARDWKYRRLSDKELIGPIFINPWVVNIYY